MFINLTQPNQLNRMKTNQNDKPSQHNEPTQSIQPTQPNSTNLTQFESIQHHQFNLSQSNPIESTNSIVRLIQYHHFNQPIQPKPVKPSE